MGWPELLREIKGSHTQEEFARLLGVSQASVSDLLRGKRSPGGKTLQALLRVAPGRREELLSLFLSHDASKPTAR